jgi:uncharacterized protein
MENKMSEVLNNSDKRKDLLKHMILQLHKGIAPDAVKSQLIDLLGQVPYGQVVEVEQELISEGLPQEEVLKLCDVHSQALKGVIDQDGAKTAPAGHPVDTFIQENRALQLEIAALEDLFKNSDEKLLGKLKQHFNNLSDVDKHYRRKENLLFPFLEKYGITGPPTVMWGKHDEARELLKASHEALKVQNITPEEFESVRDFALKPTMVAIEEMIYKEEQILFPMCLDKLTDADWYSIYQQTVEIGFCLYDPQETWNPENMDQVTESSSTDGKIQLPTGTFTAKELEAVFNNLPVDITFVDADDNVRYFNQAPERIFDRNRAILGRKVQMCHPPSSVHIVDEILNDFKSGSEDSAAFWINMGGQFIHIEYFAMKDDDGSYLGTLEVSQNLTAKRALTGEQRILNYKQEN